MEIGFFFFFVGSGYLCFSDYFYFSSGTYAGEDSYTYASASYTYFIGDADSDNIPSVHINATTSSFLYSTNSCITLSDFNFINWYGYIYYSYSSSTLNATDCIFVRGVSGISAIFIFLLSFFF
jgi:hypothetical protein